jgi:hypothetical protein
MTDDSRREIIEQALLILPNKFTSQKAKLLLAAIAYQESNFFETHQIKGPAHGYWQFEQHGGTLGVIRHRSTREIAKSLSLSFGIQNKPKFVFPELETNPILAACYARLLLWTNPRSLPSLDNEEKSWQYYFKTWRPGKPHRRTWSTSCLNAKKLWEV